jgi:predicted nucleic acid-binding protein
MAMTVLLDTNIVLHLLAGRLDEPLPPAAQYLVSIITELELLSYPDINAHEDAQIRAFLAEVRVEGITRAVKEATIRHRRANRLKLPDAIIAATAEVMNAELLTNDSQLHGLPAVRARPLRTRTAS